MNSVLVKVQSLHNQTHSFIALINIISEVKLTLIGKALEWRKLLKQKFLTFPFY